MSLASIESAIKAGQTPSKADFELVSAQTIADVSSHPLVHGWYLRQMQKNSAPRFAYPPARRGDVHHEYPGGHKVHDPYNWLEDPDSPETKAWVDSQVAFTNEYMKGLSDERNKIRARMEVVYNYVKTGTPFHEGKRL